MIFRLRAEDRHVSYRLFPSQERSRENADLCKTLSQSKAEGAGQCETGEIPSRHPVNLFHPCLLRDVCPDDRIRFQPGRGDRIHSRQ
ncbi:hypothetical protein D3C71_1224920 [compost metagenome]